MAATADLDHDAADQALGFDHRLRIRLDRCIAPNGDFDTCERGILRVDGDRSDMPDGNAAEEDGAADAKASDRDWEADEMLDDGPVLPDLGRPNGEYDCAEDQ